MNYKNTIIGKINMLKSKYLKTSLLIFGIYYVAISAIIRSDFKYIDDLGRVAKGYRGWENFSRYTSNILATLIHGDLYLTDISPLPQILAILLLAVAGTIIFYMWEMPQKFSWGILAILPLGLSPYFLECLSYKFDAPYMAISVFASILPFAFIKIGQIEYVVASFVGILLMCTTYQASSGIYPMIVVLLCFDFWNKGKSINKIFRFLIISILCYIVGMLFFRIFLMKPVEDYVSNEMVTLKQVLPNYMKHLIQYFQLVIQDFKDIWLILISLMGGLFIYVSVQETSRKSYASFLLSLITLGIMVVLSFGMYPILETPLYEPRAMYGVGVCIALIGVYIARGDKRYFCKLICTLLSWLFFVFAFTYGNALEEQKRYIDFRVENVIEGMNDLDIFSDDKKTIVQLKGNVGKSPIINNMPQDYQMLNRLVPTMFGDVWIWNECYFFNYFDLKNIVEDNSINLQALDLPVLKNTMYYTIKGNEDYALIELK